MPDASLAPVASRAMTWEDYENLGGEVRGEYIDGQLVMSPSPTRQHQQICQRLVSVLSSAVSAGHEVTAGWAWKPDQDEFVPDVMVHPTTTESTRFTGTPALIVEVLSTNRGDDLVVKTTKYAAAGLVHYWVVDPRDGVLDTFELAGTTYRHAMAVSAAVTGGRAVLGFGLSTVEVDLKALLG